MASPFQMFRRNQQVYLVVFSVMLMVAFIIVPILMDFMSGDGSTGRNDVVVKWKGGKLRQNDLEGLRRRNHTTVQFLQALVEKAQEKKEDATGSQYILPRVQSYTDVVNNLLYAERAKEKGMVLTDDAVVEYLREITDNTLSTKEVQAIHAEVALPQNVSMVEIKEEIRIGLAARYIQNLLYAGVAVPPKYHWQEFRKENEVMELEVLPVVVKDLEAEVTDEPSDNELRKLFDEGKEKFPVIGSAEFGFRQLPEIDFHFVRLDFAEFLEAAKAEVTEEEIQTEYNRGITTGLYLKRGSDSDDGDSDDGDSDDGGSTTDEADTGDDGSGGSDAEAGDGGTETGDGGTEAGSSDGLDDTETGSSEAGNTEDTDPENASTENANPEDGTADDGTADDGTAESGATESGDPESGTEESAPEDASGAAEESGTSDGENSSGLFRNERTLLVAAQPPLDGGQAAGDDAGPPNPQIPSAGGEETGNTEPTTDGDSASGDANAGDTEQGDTEQGDTEQGDTEQGSSEIADPIQPSPVPPTDLYVPLEEVRDEIVERLARPKAQQARDAAEKAITEKLKGYYIKFNSARLQESKPPRAPSARALGREHGGFGNETGLINHMEAADTELGQTQGSGNRPFDEFAFDNSTPMFTVKTATSTADREKTYVFWRAEIAADRVPEFEDVKADVEAAWKTQKARELAEEKVKTYVKTAKSSEGLTLKDRLPEQAELIKNSGEFKWLTPSIYAQYGAPPELGTVDGVDGMTDELMESIFEMQDDELGYIASPSKSAYYVVRVDYRGPSEETMRLRFTMGTRGRSFPPAAQEVFRQFQANLDESLDDALRVERIQQ